MFAARALARRAAQTPALSAASARPLATTPQRTFVSKISRYEGMSDYMSLQQMQLIRDRLAADACGVGTVVSSDTFFYMCKRAAADLGVTDDALKKLISKIDENGDDQIQFAEFQDFITSREAKQPGTLMDPAKVCAIRERLKDDKEGVGSEVSIDTFFMMVRYTCSDLGVTDAEILDLIDKIDVNGAVAASVQAYWWGRGPSHAIDAGCSMASRAGLQSKASNSPVYLHTGDRMIQKEEFDDFVKELIGV